jgi:hypothetical protein
MVILTPVPGGVIIALRLYEPSHEIRGCIIFKTQQELQYTNRFCRVVTDNLRGQPIAREIHGCISAGCCYITIMKRHLKYYVFSLLVAGWFFALTTGQPPKHQVGLSVLCQSIGMDPPYRSSGPTPQPYFKPGNKFDLTQRLTASPAGLLVIHLSVSDKSSVSLLDDPLISKFRKGVYHRYRPRDPTKA